MDLILRTPSENIKIYRRTIPDSIFHPTKPLFLDMGEYLTFASPQKNFKTVEIIVEEVSTFEQRGEMLFPYQQVIEVLSKQVSYSSRNTPIIDWNTRFDYGKPYNVIVEYFDKVNKSPDNVSFSYDVFYVGRNNEYERSDNIFSSFVHPRKRLELERNYPPYLYTPELEKYLNSFNINILPYAEKPWVKILDTKFQKTEFFGTPLNKMEFPFGRTIKTLTSEPTVVSFIRTLSQEFKKVQNHQLLYSPSNYQKLSQFSFLESFATTPINVAKWFDFDFEKLNFHSGVKEQSLFKYNQYKSWANNNHSVENYRKDVVISPQPFSANLFSADHFGSPPVIKNFALSVRDIKRISWLRPHYTAGFVPMEFIIYRKSYAENVIIPVRLAKTVDQEFIKAGTGNKALDAVQVIEIKKPLLEFEQAEFTINNNKWFDFEPHEEYPEIPFSRWEYDLGVIKRDKPVWIYGWKDGLIMNCLKFDVVNGDFSGRINDAQTFLTQFKKFPYIANEERPRNGENGSFYIYWDIWAVNLYHKVVFELKIRLEINNNFSYDRDVLITEIEEPVFYEGEEIEDRLEYLEKMKSEGHFAYDHAKNDEILASLGLTHLMNEDKPDIDDVIGEEIYPPYNPICEGDMTKKEFLDLMKEENVVKDPILYNRTCDIKFFTEQEKYADMYPDIWQTVYEICADQQPEKD